MTLTLRLCTDSDEWDQFVALSPQGNIFCTTKVLSGLLDISYDLWFLEESGKPQLGTIILKRDDMPLTDPYLFVLYQGILLSGHSQNMPIHRRTSWLLEGLQELFVGLSSRYDRLTFCMHHSFDDLRGLQWFNYHEPLKGQFKLTLRYGGLIDIKNYPDFDSYLMSLPQTRRYHYRKALAHGFSIESSTDLDLLESLYLVTMSKQDFIVDEVELKSLRYLAEVALMHNLGELLTCRDKTSGDVASITLFMWDDKTSFYVSGGNNPAYNKYYSGTLLFIENVRRAQANGLQYVDVVGMNSPQRGNFKSSCNAFVVPYYIAKWSKGQS